MTGKETDREIVMVELEQRRREAYGDMCALENNPDNKSDFVWASRRDAALSRWKELNNTISSLTHRFDSIDRLRARTDKES